MRYPSLIASNIIKESELDGRETREGRRRPRVCEFTRYRLDSFIPFVRGFPPFPPRVSLSLSLSRPRHLIRRCEHSQSQDVYLWQFNSKLHSRGAHASFSARHLKSSTRDKSLVALIVPTDHPYYSYKLFVFRLSPINRCLF